MLSKDNSNANRSTNLPLSESKVFDKVKYHIEEEDGGKAAIYRVKTILEFFKFKKQLTEEGEQELKSKISEDSILTADMFTREAGKFLFKYINKLIATDSKELKVTLNKLWTEFTAKATNESTLLEAGFEKLKDFSPKKTSFLGMGSIFKDVKDTINKAKKDAEEDKQKIKKALYNYEQANEGLILMKEMTYKVFMLKKVLNTAQNKGSEKGEEDTDDNPNQYEKMLEKMFKIKFKKELRPNRVIEYFYQDKPMFAIIYTVDMTTNGQTDITSANVEISFADDRASKHSEYYMAKVCYDRNIIGDKVVDFVKKYGDKATNESVIIEAKIDTLKDKPASLKALAPKLNIKKGLTTTSDEKDNRMTGFKSIDAKNDLYESDSTIDGCKVKIKVPVQFTTSPEFINNANIVISLADRHFDDICKTVFSYLTKWPEDAITKEATNIKCKDALLDVYMDDNSYYALRIKLLLTSSIKDHEKVIAGICVNSKTKAIDIRYWDKWPLDYTNESVSIQEIIQTLTESSEMIDKKEVNFFGTKVTIPIIKSDDEEKISDKLLSKVDNVIKYITTPALYNYLVKLHSKMFDEISNDDYFDGKSIKSGNDLIEAIKEQIKHKNTMIFVSERYNTIFLCGEYWCDDEHGYSISFPGGKFIKANSLDNAFNKDYEPVATALGQYSSYL